MPETSRLYWKQREKDELTFPISFSDWSFSSLFDREIQSACPVSDRSAVTVQLPLDGQDYQLTPAYDSILDKATDKERPMAYYDLSQRKFTAQGIAQFQL